MTQNTVMKKVSKFLGLFILFLALSCLIINTSAFTVTGVAIDPSGFLSNGTSVNVNYKVDVSGSFPSGGALKFYTDLDNPTWTFTIIVNGVENLRPLKSESTFSITGFELSYKPSDEVSIRMILTGNTPPNPSPSQNLVKIQELDSSGNIVSSSVYTLAMPATPTPTPTSVYSSISVSSTPSGANVYLDNAYKGLTTLPMDGIANGNHIILVRLAGYQDWTQNVTVLGNSTSLTATLVAISNTTTTTTTVTPTPTLNSTANGTINIKSSPSISKVFVNNVYQGYTPMILVNITPGNYVVMVRSAGYNEWSGSVKVTAGNTSFVTASLVLAPDETTDTTTAPKKMATTVKTPAKSTAKIPTPWPTDTPKKSPIEITVILGAIGIGFIVLRKP